MASNHEYIEVHITDLFLNTENPRFDPVNHQTEAIEAMIEDQQEKLIRLGHHIVEYGMDPTSIIMVVPQENHLIVYEGNRRVTALKLINEPALVPEKYKKMKKEFQKFNQTINPILLESVYCVKMTNPNEAFEWVRLRHTGENEGAGTVRWDATQSSRFSTYSKSKIDYKLLFFESLSDLETIPSKLKTRLKNVRKTNFDRLISDPDVRELLGISKKDNRYSLLNDQVSQYLIAVLTDLASDGFSVGKIYHKKDRESYIESIKAKVDEEPGDDDIDCPGTSIEHHEEREDNVSLETYEDDSKNDGVKETKQRKSYPIKRSTLVPRQNTITIINQPRLLKIFNELKKINVNEFPNAVAVLFRTFIELSADQYIKKLNLSVGGNDSLSKKIDIVIKQMELQFAVPKSDLHTARQMASSPTQNVSVKTFHGYVHNSKLTPVADDLKTAWDDLWPFIKGLWE